MFIPRSTYKRNMLLAYAGGVLSIVIAFQFLDHYLKYILLAP